VVFVTSENIGRVVFHNWKRIYAGLPSTRTREWLLEIEFRKRETFAYSCEAYGWIVEHARSRADRMSIGREYAAGAHRFQDDHLDTSELASIVSEACAALIALASEPGRSTT